GGGVEGGGGWGGRGGGGGGGGGGGVLLVVPGLVNLIAVGKRGRLIRNHGGGGQNGRCPVQGRVQGRSIYKGLENRSRGSLGDRVIQLAEGIVTSSHQCQYLPRVRIYRHQGHLRVGSGFHLGLVLILANLYFLGPKFGDLVINQLDTGLDRLRRCLLQLGIESRVDAVRLLVQFPLV